MFWFSTQADFSYTFFNGLEVVFSGKVTEPTQKVNMTLVQRDSKDEPVLVWQGELPSSKFIDTLHFLHRLPRGFGPKETLAEHLSRISKYDNS